jgi:hypothetical protein
MRGYNEWRMSRLMSKLKNTRRSYGGTTTVAKSGPATEHVLMPRGLIPAPPVNYKLVAAAVSTFSAATFLMWYTFHERQKRLQLKWEEFEENNFEHWRDFENGRQSKHSKVLAESPCGEQFKSAYLCALFPESEGQSCGGDFESFAKCVQANPLMMRSVKPNGDYNFESKLVLLKLGEEMGTYKSNIEAAGPAEEDLDEVLNEYRARFKLGPNASESEVKSYLAKFKTVRDNFGKELTELWNATKTNTGEAQRLYKQLLKEYSIPADVWLEVLKEYDVEEFDEALTKARRKYGWLSNELKKHKALDKVNDVDLSNVTCGEDFAKWYKCLTERKESSDCADIVDELYFCRQNNTQHVWPYMKSFEKQDPSFKAEFARLQEILKNNPIID